MRIVIDLQGAQSAGSRNRGIGRYSLAIAKAIARNRGPHQVLLALSAYFPETIETIRAEFDSLLRQEDIRVWQAPAPVSHWHKENDWRRGTAELIREAFLASLKPDIVVVSSLFEGLGEDVVTSVGTLSVTIPTAVILYDLIPLIYRHHYLDSPVTEAFYENKLAHLRRANLLLAISESSLQEAMAYLNFPPDACVAISTAADSQFRPLIFDRDEELQIRQRYGLVKPFLLFMGGLEPRKNVDGLIRAYARLPTAVRAAHQLAVVCSIRHADRQEVMALAREQGLAGEELVQIGFVPEGDLPKLYNLCKAFVFPSWHEGFGLPALEAMCCGRAVIGANTSSVPEVIGRNDALFDPRDDAAIAEKLLQVLADDTFRSQLERHGLEQAQRFSWDQSALRAINGIETWLSGGHSSSAKDIAVRRRKLAYISPLPPEPSSIGSDSAFLLPELARYYDIDVVIAQDAVSDPWIRSNCTLRSVPWFEAHADRYDRVLYQFGNSKCHQHMFDLLEAAPGIVVLHDFFLSEALGHHELTDKEAGSWAQCLYHSHGYGAVRQRFQDLDAVEVMSRYPCNRGVLQHAVGVVAHSERLRGLAGEWYGAAAAEEFSVIPRGLAPVTAADRAEARRSLRLGAEDFVICYFGDAGPTKLNQRVLDTWLASTLAKSPNCVLVYVGEIDKSDYGAARAADLRQRRMKKRIIITGGADEDALCRYLGAADAAIQLHAGSGNEVSGRVLECLNRGLPTIVNGVAADLPDDVVMRLPHDFSDSELREALESLWASSELCGSLGDKAREFIRMNHSPRICADRYFEAIEAAYRASTAALPGLTRALRELEPKPTNPNAWAPVAEAIHRSIPPRLSPRQILVDVSELVNRDARSGIQRVVRSLLGELLRQPPEGYRVEPVYATIDQPGYRYARRWTLAFLECPELPFDDDLLDYQAGDVFLGLDLQSHVVPAQKDFFRRMRQVGVDVEFVVYDLLPITLPQAFPEQSTRIHENWLSVVTENDGALCISRAIAEELSDWVERNGPVRRRPFKINWFHLGSDIEASVPTTGMPDDAENCLRALSNRPSFLMVGTVEPRKGHRQALSAFEHLWADDVGVNLVIVGKQGWMVEELAQHLRRHPELGRRLFWFDHASDEFLEKLMATVTALLAASEGEGFGLPLIEAARHKLPIIARDIPVFREVAGKHAFFFHGLDAGSLAESIKRWLALYEKEEFPPSEGLPWLTWKQSTQQLLDRLLAASVAA